MQLQMNPPVSPPAIPTRPTVSRLARLWLLASWLAGAAGHADTITWFSAVGSTNLTSTGTTMSAAFNFELGVFKDGFVPNAGNTDQWAAKWVSAQRVAYNQDNKLFTGQFTVVDNTAPFTVGTPAYIWGFQGSTPSAEWILFRSATWAWPVAGAMNPPGGGRVGMPQMPRPSWVPSTLLAVPS